MPAPRVGDGVGISTIEKGRPRFGIDREVSLVCRRVLGIDTSTATHVREPPNDNGD
jgi:hypothetical protein